MTFNDVPGEGGDSGEGDGGDDAGEGDGGEGEGDEGGEDSDGDGGSNDDGQDRGTGSGGTWPPFDIYPDNPVLMDTGGRIWEQGLETDQMHSGLLR